jgi:hypothetical protein
VVGLLVVLVRLVQAVAVVVAVVRPVTALQVAERLVATAV